MATGEAGYYISREVLLCAGLNVAFLYLLGLIRPLLVSSCWKRGPLRSGSSRSGAGVSRTFAANGDACGIESSLRKAAITRSAPAGLSFNIGNIWLTRHGRRR